MSEKSRHTGSTVFKEYVLQQGCKCILYFFLEGHVSDHVNIFIGHNRKLVGQHSTYKQAFEKIFLSAPKKCQGSFYFPDQRWDSNFFPQTLIHRHRHTNKSQKSALILTLSLPKMTNLTKQRKSLNPKLPNEI